MQQGKHGVCVETTSGDSCVAQADRWQQHLHKYQQNSLALLEGSNYNNGAGGMHLSEQIQGSGSTRTVFQSSDPMVTTATVAAAVGGLNVIARAAIDPTEASLRCQTLFGLATAASISCRWWAMYTDRRVLSIPHV